MSKKRKKSKIENPALRSFLLALKATLLVILLVVLIGGIVFYFAYGKQFIAMQKEASQNVAASTVDTFRSAETSLIFDAKGKEISEIKGEKDVFYLDTEQIPDYVKTAFVSIEDKKFYEHGGVDYLAIMRAAFQYVKKGRVTQGGSTITQQLVRNVFISKEVTMDRKIREMFYAMEMEKRYTKDQILEFYINNVYFANGYYGIEAAAQGYFNKDVNKLSLSQVAFLCAIPNGPTLYNPLNHYDNTIDRRNLILKNMLDDGKILIEEYQAAVDEKIELKVQEQKKRDYLETFSKYCAVRALMQSQGFIFKNKFASAEEKKEYKAEYNELYETCEQSLYSGGYRIYTSISMTKQKALQNAVNDVLKNFTEKTDAGIYKMQGAAVCISNNTGRVVAIVGGRKQDVSEGYTLNRAFQSFRQPGSSIKPLIVYTPAFENGYTPESIVSDKRFEGGPRNSDGKYSGNIPIRSAVAASKNVIAWKLFEEITPKVGLSYILNMGFSNIVDSDYYPASSLGGLTNGVSPLEMASGFATIENEGYYREPTCIVKITDARDNVIYKNKNKKKQIYSKESAHMMTSCMESVFESGTARGLQIGNMKVAGKTGTTNDKKDGWFCGFSAYYTTAVWVGYDTPRTVSDLYGSTYPGHIWQTFMQGIHTGLTYKDLMDNYANKRDTRNNIEDEKETEETEEPEETEDVDDEEEVSETPLPDSWTEGGSNGEDPEPEITSEPNSGIISEPVDNGGNADSDAGAGDSEPSAEEEN
ncbi:MAG: PBP1A family penicillin-binding protein [Lachnospiraceae bacterium]|nr:PBP1A family penicillin-binding protein [Lachnospiraceae bacterium]